MSIRTIRILLDPPDTHNSKLIWSVGSPMDGPITLFFRVHQGSRGGKQSSSPHRVGIRTIRILNISGGKFGIQFFSFRYYADNWAHLPIYTYSPLPTRTNYPQISPFPIVKTASSAVADRGLSRRPSLAVAIHISPSSSLNRRRRPSHARQIYPPLIARTTRMAATNEASVSSTLNTDQFIF